MADKRKLTLHRETLRELTKEDLRHVRGGDAPTAVRCHPSEMPSENPDCTQNPTLTEAPVPTENDC